MSSHKVYAALRLHPLFALTITFVAWKSLLFLVVTNCPGPGYDTSTTLLLPSIVVGDEQTSGGVLGSFWRFVRWDSIYFVRVAERGYLYEQEWAWGLGYTKLLSYFSHQYNSDSLLDLEPRTVAVIGIAVSHIGHYLSVLVLYALTSLVFGTETELHKSISVISAVLHIISPAGAFLSAPYGESLFAFLNYSGYFAYLAGIKDHITHRPLWRDCKLILAGFTFAVATTIRSNGILGGILFAFDACQVLLEICSCGFSWSRLRYLSVIGIGGSIVALGIIGPQYIAYQQFCVTSTSPTPPWCRKVIPSIYAWVQSHYWNVGFLRYWTVSNIPLFLLAAPMLYLLCRSSLFAITHQSLQGDAWSAWQSPVSSNKLSLTYPSLVRLAIPQAFLAVAALTSYHVQIINRIASGYPLWYWYLASLAIAEVEQKHGLRGAKRGAFAATIQTIVLYGLIQGVLFGSFLPPA